MKKEEKKNGNFQKLGFSKTFGLRVISKIARMCGLPYLSPSIRTESNATPMLQLHGAKDYRVIIDNAAMETILFNYYNYAAHHKLPHCCVVKNIDSQDFVSILKDGDGEIIIQPETIARMLHELSEENFNNFINVLIHEYYGRTR